MFTGIVQSQAEVIAVIAKNNAVSLKILVENKLIEQLEVGARVAINGVCLTAVEFGRANDESHHESSSSQSYSNKSFMVFDVIDETLRVSNLAQVKVGSIVNVERSLKIGDEIGGHMLSGHVHTQAVVSNRLDTQDNCTLSFTIATEFQKYVFAKGFISINGISLTLGADVVSDNTGENSATKEASDTAEHFSVHLIPETLARTNLQQVKIGDKVNIEFDQQTITIVDTIERMQLTVL